MISDEQYKDEYESDIDDDAFEATPVDDTDDTDQEETPSKKSNDVKSNEIPEELKDVAEDNGKYYLTNKTLLPAVIRAKEAGYITDELTKMLMLLSDRYSRKFCFVGYTFREDMASEAVINLLEKNKALKFDPEVSSNPFAYYTQAIKRSFFQYIEDEKTEHYIRDTLLVENGAEPSAGYADSPITRKVQESKAKAESKRKKKARQAAEQDSLNDDMLQF